MSRYWSTIVHHLSPYVPGEQPQMARLVKLNTNENPYPPSPAVAQAIAAQLQHQAEALRLYPDPASLAVRQAVAALHPSITPEHVFVGNGSDEVLGFAFCGLLQHVDEQGRARPLLFPDISYSFYPTWCKLYGIEHRAVPLDGQLMLHIDDYIGQRDAGAVIFPNPNAPTGRGITRAEIRRLLMARRDMVVVVDEAYVDFGAQSVVPLVAEHPNLLVVHTLSKSRSLAGLRVGYAIGQPPLIQALVRVKDSFNSYPVDRLAAAGAVAALGDTLHFERARDALIATREALANDLAALGFEVLPSQANFVFARHPRRTGALLQMGLRERGIIVRRFSQPERIADHLRITVGTPTQCAELLQALRELLASAG